MRRILSINCLLASPVVCCPGHVLHAPGLDDCACAISHDRSFAAIDRFEMAEFTDSMIDVRSISDYSRPQSFPCDQAPIWSPFRPLRSAILCTPAVQFIDADVRTQLLYADECLYHQRHSEAIPYLESGLFAIGCRRYGCNVLYTPLL